MGSCSLSATTSVRFAWAGRDSRRPAVAGNGARPAPSCSRRSPPGKWYHLAATFKRPVIKTYVNGQEVGTTRWDYPVGYKGDLIIGKWGGANGHQGLIDEVKLFKRALDAAEIAASYQEDASTRAELPADAKAYEEIPRSSQLAAAAATVENEFAKLAISPRGRCTALIDKQSGEDYLLRTSPLVSIKQDSRDLRALRMRAGRR